MATLILFDIDGTLIHGRGVGRMATELAMNEVFGTCGALADYQFRGKTDWGTLIELLMPLGFERARIDSAIGIYNETVGRHFTAVAHRFAIEPCPGGPELVAALRSREDALLGLVTGNAETVAPLKLAAAGYDPAHFPVGAYGSEAHERALLPPMALRRAGVYYGGAFERSVIIGDTPDDILCARSIGARSVAVASGSFSRAALEAYAPAVTLDSLTDLAAAQAAIFG